MIWVAYRYYGDPNRELPVPAEEAPERGPEEQYLPRCRVFDENGRLSTGVFGFALSDVLLRAAKRRNYQARALVSIEDMIAGMVRGET